MIGDPVLDRVASLLGRARRILFITGAGISADSGLPTYRGIGGLYHDRLTAEGLTIEEALVGRDDRRCAPTSPGATSPRSRPIAAAPDRTRHIA